MIIDSYRQVIILDDNSEVPLYTPEGFEPFPICGYR